MKKSPRPFYVPTTTLPERARQQLNHLIDKYLDELESRYMLKEVVICPRCLVIFELTPEERRNDIHCCGDCGTAILPTDMPTHGRDINDLGEIDLGTLPTRLKQMDDDYHATDSNLRKAQLYAERLLTVNYVKGFLDAIVGMKPGDIPLEMWSRLKDHGKT